MSFIFFIKSTMRIKREKNYQCVILYSLKQTILNKVGCWYYMYFYMKVYTILCFYLALKYSDQAQKRQNFIIENLTWWKIRKRERWPTTSLSLVLFTCCCPHVFVHMLASNWISTFVHEFCAWNIMPSVNFLSRNVFVKNIMTKIFHTNFLELKLTQMKIKQITISTKQITVLRYPHTINAQLFVHAPIIVHHIMCHENSMAITCCKDT